MSAILLLVKTCSFIV